MSRIKYIKNRNGSAELSYSPYRKMLFLISIICIVVMAGTYIVGSIVYFNEGPKEIIYVAGVFFVIAVASVVIASCVFANKDARLEKERYAYLFDPNVKPFEGEKLKVENGVFMNGSLADEYNNLYDTIYTALTRDGIFVYAKQKGRSIFSDCEAVKEKELSFSPLKKCLFSFGVEFYKLRICFSLLWMETEGGRVIRSGEIPMSKELFAAMKAFGIDKKMKDPIWTYLMYNPEDAFKQLYNGKQIRRYRNKKGAKPIVDQWGNFI